MFTAACISGKVKENSACNFLEKNFTAVISQDFCSFQVVSQVSARFKENVCTKKLISVKVIEYFLQTFKKRSLQAVFKLFQAVFNISKLFSKSFETKQIKKLSLPSEFF